MRNEYFFEKEKEKQKQSAERGANFHRIFIKFLGQAG
jgi:hypothetical protein